ncbi:MAG TPA: sulfatase, partial [Thermoanaerobaculia bacterium]|nr:sulfatase [Thermoanaerobaculia bacterium]
AGSADRGGGLLLAAPAIRSARAPRLALAAAPARPWSGRPNIVLYLVDTLRADRLGCYGETKPLSPAIDAFARGATLFERAVAQATWTRPAVTSVLTGLGPLSHGVQTLDDRLPAAAVTLPEMLQAAGYRTAGFSTNLHVSAATGLAQGFDRFELLPGETRSDAVNRRVTRWLDDSRGKPPFFLYVQTLDPHAPYDPLPEMRRRFAAGVPPGLGATDEIVRTYPMRGEARARRIAQLSALYDAEVAGNDRSFGELLAALKERGLYDSALVVFMADHGEEFDEHGGLGHAINLYSPTLHVPLIVKWPREAEGRRVARLAQHVDLLPTLLAAAELRPPPGLPGTDLYPLAELPAAAPEDTGRAAFSHLSYAERQGMSLVTGGWKLILPLSRRFGRGPELYRLDADRDERDDLSDRDEVRAGWLLARIRRELLLAHPAHAAERVPIDEETRKALGALGYL